MQGYSPADSAPTKGLKYPKGRDKPPFETMGQIERRVARGGLTGEEVKELWDRLFLSKEQVDELAADLPVGGDVGDGGAGKGVEGELLAGRPEQ
jgi:hypothetical protein